MEYAGVEKEIQARLLSMQDIKYRDFQAKLMPNIDKELIIGVRTPELREYAKEFSKTAEASIFIQTPFHHYYEEKNLHGFIIETIKDFESAVEAICSFLPCVDNWATCDSISPKVFKKNTEKLLPYIKSWIESNETYTVRFAVKMLMALYLDENFTPDLLELVVKIESKEYYINMMKAWYFATALAKQYDSTIPIISGYFLDSWTHNKTIQKAVESYRITLEQKEYLKSLKLPKES